MGPVGVGRRAMKEGGYGLTTVPLVLPYPTPQKPGTQPAQLQGTLSSEAVNSDLRIFVTAVNS